MVVHFYFIVEEFDIDTYLFVFLKLPTKMYSFVMYRMKMVRSTDI